MTEEKYLDPSADFQVFATDESIPRLPPQDPYPEIIPDWRVFPNEQIPEVNISAVEEAITKKYDITVLFKQMRDAT